MAGARLLAGASVHYGTIVNLDLPIEFLSGLSKLFVGMLLWIVHAWLREPVH